MIGLLSILGLFEGMGFLVVFIYSLIKINKLVIQTGGAIIQKNIDVIGRILTFLGFVTAVVVPRLTGIREQALDDDKLFVLYFLLATLGFLMFYVGSRFWIAAYKKPEETEKWIFKLVDLWKSFWRSE